MGVKDRFEILEPALLDVVEPRVEDAGAVA